MLIVETDQGNLAPVGKPGCRRFEVGNDDIGLEFIEELHQQSIAYDGSARAAKIVGDRTEGADFVVDTDDVQSFNFQAIELFLERRIAAVIADHAYLVALLLQVAQHFPRPACVPGALSGYAVHYSAHMSPHCLLETDCIRIQCAHGSRLS